MPRLAGVFAASVSSLLAAAPAEAEKYQFDYFAWQIAETQQPAAEARWVEPYRSFVSIKLLPQQSYEAESAVKTKEGVQILDAKTELMGLAGPVKAVCTANSRLNKPTFFTNAKAANICFIDSNGDGLFDQHFPHARRLHGEITILKKRKDVVPFAASPALATGTRSEEALHIEYFGARGDDLEFAVCVQKDVTRSAAVYGFAFYLGCIGPELKVKKTALPATFEALGARFLVEARNGDLVQVRQITPIPPQNVTISAFLN